jgi:hypothetical protein
MLSWLPRLALPLLWLLVSVQIGSQRSVSPVEWIIWLLLGTLAAATWLGPLLKWRDRLFGVEYRVVEDATTARDLVNSERWELVPQGEPGFFYLRRRRRDAPQTRPPVRWPRTVQLAAGAGAVAMVAVTLLALTNPDSVFRAAPTPTAAPAAKPAVPTATVAAKVAPPPNLTATALARGEGEALEASRFLAAALEQFMQAPNSYRSTAENAIANAQAVVEGNDSPAAAALRMILPDAPAAVASTDRAALARLIVQLRRIQ